MKTLGLYLHVPFCKSKCGYCDFYSMPQPTEQTLQAYVDRLCEDLRATAKACEAYAVDTVYLGGGTPTLLPTKALEQILETVTSCYRVEEKAEITTECNPATADREKLERMRAAGYNRLSIGVQSGVERELRALGRAHTREDVERVWEAALAAGFSNLSADLMLGIPHQTLESLRESLILIDRLDPKHLSAYTLTVEPNTPFGRIGEGGLHLPDEDGVSDMYLYLVEELGARGLAQYEISNFAKEGFASKHNLKYWSCEEYLGFGPAAHSDFGGARWGNSRSLGDYLAGRSIREGERSIGTAERLEEYVMLQMRLNRGVSFAEIERRFGKEARERFEVGFSQYCEGGFLNRTERGVSFTPKGMLVSNSILAELLEFGL